MNGIYSNGLHKFFYFNHADLFLIFEKYHFRVDTCFKFSYKTFSLFMSKPTNPANPPDEHWSKTGVPAPFKVNRRMGIRYIRRDIGVTIRKIGLFNFNMGTNQESSVKLVDISSRGVMVSTEIKLSLKKQVLLTIRFADFKEYKILGKVVRKSEGDALIYGIKFDKVNNKLADKLLATQRKLSFT